VDFSKNLTIPENTSKYLSEDGVYFLCTSMIIIKPPWLTGYQRHY
jgi:hypothetical protein